MFGSLLRCFTFFSLLISKCLFFFLKGPSSKLYKFQSPQHLDAPLFWTLLIKKVKRKSVKPFKREETLAHPSSWGLCVLGKIFERLKSSRSKGIASPTEEMLVLCQALEGAEALITHLKSSWISSRPSAFLWGWPWTPLDIAPVQGSSLTLSYSYLLSLLPPSKMLRK